MTNQTPSRIGQTNAAGDVDALFLKVFAGEVLSAFERTNVTMSRHSIRTITSGKSAQFPVTGRVSAFYHTPGAEILGGSVNHAERVITIDDKLIAPVFFADIDEAKTHYDVRGPVSSECGSALANQMDRHVLQVGILAARTVTPTVTDLPGGSTITEAVLNDYRDGTKLAAALFTAAQTLDEKWIPSEGRVFFCKPQHYYALVQAEKTIHRDYGGMGAYSDGKVYRVAGFEIVMTNNLPTTNITVGVAAGTSNRYAGNFNKTVGLVCHPSAMGTVKLMDLSTRMDWDPRRDGTQVVARYAVGHGILRPESAIEIKSL